MAIFRKMNLETSKFNGKRVYNLSIIVPKMAIFRKMNLETTKFNGGKGEWEWEWGGGGYF